MPPHLSADRPAAPPPDGGPVEALITQTRRLKGEVDAVRRDAPADLTDPRGRWRQALYDLALHHLDDLDAHLAQLRDGPAPAPGSPPPAPPPSQVGSAEWNLLTDEAVWSPELQQILGRDPAAAALTLDELPSVVLDEDRPRLTVMVTDCLIDARPIDGEFRIVRPDGETRVLHIMGEPVLAPDGSTNSMWAVLRDVSELRRSQRAVRETRDSLHLRRPPAPSVRPPAAPSADAGPDPEPPPWHASLRLPRGGGPRSLDLAARHLPGATGSALGATWFDTLELSDGETLLSMGDLTGQGPSVPSSLATTVGALRGMALAGTRPGQLLSLLSQLIDADARPTLAGALCCRYRPATRTLMWARAGHPAPLLFRDGTGYRLDAPDGVLLGAASGTAYGQAQETLVEGDLLLLHTCGLVPGGDPAATSRLLDLAPRFAAARDARTCVDTVVETFGRTGRDSDASVLVARVTA
ncbi:SpoIIE family protein phosphatase [Streptomyces sp. NPDC086091]|uniref:SpoIIE family protein phosphatase n=1 Tax=Streptomyces sp. NPDC086091 TaxID=3365751 RepID=UPI0037FDD197